MAGIAQLKIVFDEYKTDANEAVVFKLVRNEGDMFDDNTTFKPDMSHQIFGSSETIFGYKDLEVQIFYTAAYLHTYVNLKYSEKINPDKFDGIKADKVISKIAEVIPAGFSTNEDMFLAKLSKEQNFKPFGELIHTYTVNKDDRNNRQFEVYKTDISCPGFREYHERLQTFLLWYVDAASFIDVDDAKWTFYLVYEKYIDTGKPNFAIAGYMTVYNYYAYPEKIRPRISQVLVLPPFQKMGHCAWLLQAFYNDVVSDSKVLDVTVEDPNEAFQRVRDFVDVKNCFSLKCFTRDFLKQGFSAAMATEAREKLKINKRQARRVYEIIGLYHTNCADKDDLKRYRLDVKRRLNLPFMKNGRDFEKLKKTLKPDELSATMNNMNNEQRLECLQQQYEECIDYNRKILDRLSAT